MPTIHDVVLALSDRPGVDAVILLGRDGLPIDAQAGNGLDPDGLAALIPSVVAACNRLGTAAGRGDFGTGVVEFAAGMLLVSAITPETLLAILVAADSNAGVLLYEIQRHRSAIAELL
ncbi:MAG TPA: roadblock/LC7 domain-containing protein [Gemmatimonadales bacterium]